MNQKEENNELVGASNPITPNQLNTSTDGLNVRRSSRKSIISNKLLDQDFIIDVKVPSKKPINSSGVDSPSKPLNNTGHPKPAAKSQQSEPQVKGTLSESTPSPPPLDSDWLQVGRMVEVCDEAGAWYKARVIDERANQVRVHFQGWNSRYDAWYDTSSAAKLRPCPVAATADKTTKNNSSSNADPTHQNQVSKTAERKSSRVKETRTYNLNTIVFDSPMSKLTYSNGNSSKRKRGEDEPSRGHEEPETSVVEEEEEAHKAKAQSKVKSYFKQLSQSKKIKKLSSVSVAAASLKKKSIRTSNEKNKKKKKKHHDHHKKKRLQKELFERLVETSKSNVELIEKELNERQSKKMRKRLHKLMKQRQREEEMRKQALMSHIQASLSQSFLLQQQTSTTTSVEKPVETISKEPIMCTWADCKKSFRKQSLLDYHIKYHHCKSASEVVKSSSTLLLTTVSSKEAKSGSKSAAACTTTTTKEVDAYEVIHCKCGQNVNRGFMIQCECCLCWAHGDCFGIDSDDQVASNYLCWVCKEPANHLKRLKYQSWQNKSSSSSSNHAEGKLSDSAEDVDRMNMLNALSKVYFNLNSLMYTLDFQMSVFGKQVRRKLSAEKENELSEMRSSGSSDPLEDLDALNRNIKHLKTSISEKFEYFYKKMDEFEARFYSDEALASLDHSVSSVGGLSESTKAIEELFAKLRSI